MTQLQFKTPTDKEIRKHIREGQKLQAEALANMLRSAARWLAHPYFGFRRA